MRKIALAAARTRTSNFSSRFNAASPRFKVQGSRFKVQSSRFSDLKVQSDPRVDDKVINDYEFAQFVVLSFLRAIRGLAFSAINLDYRSVCTTFAVN